MLVISICGCTTSTTSPNQATSGPASSGTLAADNLAGAINMVYTDKGYTVNTPFAMTQKGNAITYHGVVTDGEQSAIPYKRDITVVLTKDRSTAWATYDAAIATQKSKNYEESITSNSSGLIYWHGYLGTTNSSNPATPKVYIAMYEPTAYIGLMLGGASGTNEYLNNADVDNYYQILTNQQTIVK